MESEDFFNLSRRYGKDITLEEAFKKFDEEIRKEFMGAFE